jgi:hypothetical protein
MYSKEVLIFFNHHINVEYRDDVEETGVIEIDGEESDQPPTKKKKMQAIDHFFTKPLTREAQFEIDRETAYFIYSSGCPLSICEHPSFKRFVRKLNSAASVPSRKRVSGTLLKECYERGVDALKEKIQSSGYLTIGTDAWTNVNGQPSINYVVMNSDVSYLLDSKETVINSHTSDYLKNDFITYIDPYRKVIAGGLNLRLLKSKKLTVLAWWKRERKEFPVLSNIALRIFSLVASTAAVERTFKIQGLVHTKLRNRLTSEVCKKLTFIRVNPSLYDRNISDSSSILAMTDTESISSESTNDLEEVILSDLESEFSLGTDENEE